MPQMTPPPGCANAATIRRNPTIYIVLVSQRRLSTLTFTLLVFDLNAELVAEDVIP